MQYAGVLLGVFSLLSIGLGHMWVVKLEYHLGARIWPLVVILGAVLVLASLWVDHTILSAMLGIFGFIIIWGGQRTDTTGETGGAGLVPSQPQEAPAALNVLNNSPSGKPRTYTWVCPATMLSVLWFGKKSNQTAILVVELSIFQHVTL